MGSTSIPEDALGCVLAKYEAEKQKRYRSDGMAQYVDVDKSDKFKHYAEDPWIELDGNTRTPSLPPISNSGYTKVVILGAGFGALTFAVHLINSGVFKAKDFVFIDQAGGFGGVWYWNCYPGLMCDVESACYLPLLEETGYMPKNKYAYGPELKAYAELVAEKWNLQGRGLWQTTMLDASWDETTSEWVYNVVRKKGISYPEEVLKIRSDVFILLSGLLTRPKLPNFPGLEDFGGHMFHTARWDYNYTGGSRSDPALTKLGGKRVAFLGTGATGVQAVPELAKWAGKLYVIQRTPASVSERGQEHIDPVQWQKDTAKKGWQRTRRENMAAFLSNDSKVTERIVQDDWTSFPSFSGLVCGPNAGGLTAETVEAYIHSLLKLDFPRQEAVRARVDAVVQDPVTAESLKPWYPGWCKRPCFHDEYLQTFNNPNVEPVDTDGKGIESCTKTGLVVGSKELDIDVLILGTGFEPWTAGSPAYRANITVCGRNGLSLDEKWNQGIGTLHGMLTRGFPNLILPGSSQAGVTVNIIHSMDVIAQHAASVYSAATKMTVGEYTSNRKLILEPTEAAEEAWTMSIASGTYAMAPLAVCTPSYVTLEGALMQKSSPKDQLKLAKGSLWSKGILDFVRLLEAWEAKGDLDGIDIKVAEK